MSGRTLYSRGMADAVLVALQLHEDLPSRGITATATELAIPSAGCNMRFVLGLRMRRARQLLSGTDKPPAEVATRANYSDSSSFHRPFSALSAVTPGSATLVLFAANSRRPSKLAFTGFIGLFGRPHALVTLTRRIEPTDVTRGASFAGEDG